MLQGTQSIYFDESGFTGNNLLHPDQPIFIYAGVAVHHEEAAACVEELICTYGIQGGELKGSRLVKFNKGRKVISSVLSRYHDRIKAVAHDKKYSLAGKFFEYIFEPTISANNVLFYSLGFHKFVANLLYMHFKVGARYAEDIFADFERFMRSSDTEGLTQLFVSRGMNDISPALEQIMEFALLNRDSVLKEIDSMRGTGAGKWILDLTDTSLTGLLGHYGDIYEQMTVYCDASKPLADCIDIFDAMVNREEKTYLEFNGRKRLITYNLSERPQFVDSKEHPGIQLADVAASAFAYALQNPREEISQEWSKYIPECIHDDSIFPELERVDLERFEVKRNAVLLCELHERSRQGSPLLEGLPEFMNMISHRLLTDPPF